MKRDSSFTFGIPAENFIFIGCISSLPHVQGVKHKVGDFCSDSGLDSIMHAIFSRYVSYKNVDVQSLRKDIYPESMTYIALLLSLVTTP